jgi:hypothetical protein
LLISIAIVKVYSILLAKAVAAAVAVAVAVDQATCINTVAVAEIHTLTTNNVVNPMWIPSNNNKVLALFIEDAMAK